jgi:hypothetical protein
MSDTPVNIPDYVIMVDPESKNQLRDLAEVLVEMLGHVEGLPGPNHACLSIHCREISLLFPGDQEAFAVLGKWAEQFGGTVTASPGTDSDGKSLVIGEVRFAYLGASVEAHAYIRTPF